MVNRSPTTAVPSARQPAPIIWGSAGTVGQHSFHQLLHQGTQSFAVDFVLALKPSHELDADDPRHQHLVANCLAQSEALANGKSFEQALAEVKANGIEEPAASLLAKQKVISGSKPHTLIAMEKVDAYSLGALIALYEHKTFVQSVIWGINAFDQWGVELGKQLSKPIFDAMTVEAASDETAIGTKSVTDPVTNDWIERYRNTNPE